MRQPLRTAIRQAVKEQVTGFQALSATYKTRGSEHTNAPLVRILASDESSHISEEGIKQSRSWLLSRPRSCAEAEYAGHMYDNVCHLFSSAPRAP